MDRIVSNALPVDPEILYYGSPGRPRIGALQESRIRIGAEHYRGVGGVNENLPDHGGSGITSESPGNAPVVRDIQRPRVSFSIDCGGISRVESNGEACTG